MPETCPSISVLMLGPALNVQGGISTVEKNILQHWTDNKYIVIHLPTHRDGKKLQKLALFLKALFNFPIMVYTHKPRLVYIHFSSRASFYRKAIFIYLSKIFNLKIILEAHGSEFDLFYNKESNKVQKEFIKYIINKADHLIVLGKEWFQFYSKIYQLPNISILPNPIVIPDEKIKIKCSPIVLNLGRLGTRKGTYDLLNAFENILSILPEAELWLGGDGEIEQVKRLIVDKAWGQQVKILGWVSGAHLVSCFQKAKIFVLPSYREGMPMALLEAMSYGIPSITTQVGGIPELIQDGVNGFLIKPGDVVSLTNRLAELLRDNMLCQEIGEKARQTIISQYDVYSMLNRLCTIFDGVLE